MTVKAMRSKLFVPGSRPELFAKALAGAADALSFDLEDAVADALKATAREHIAALLRSDPARQSSKLLIVRTNHAASPHFAADAKMVVDARVAMLNLPKVDDADALHRAVAQIEGIERSCGREDPVQLLVNIETPRALRNAAAIASASPRVAGLQLGLADLFLPAGIDRRERANVHAALFATRMAAAEAGVLAFDAAFADIGDAASFEAEAAASRALGFVGKSCIHPGQVPVANRIYTPTDHEVAAATRIVDAADALAEEAAGVFVVDGTMVDAPFLRHARAVLAAAELAAS